MDAQFWTYFLDGNGYITIPVIDSIVSELWTRKKNTITIPIVTSFRKKDLGIVFQEDYLLMEFTAIENIMLPHIISGNSRQDSYNKAYNFLEKFDLLSIKNSYPNTLSGGEKQRISILRAIINNPKLILADEPTGSIDEFNKEKIFSLFKDIINFYNSSILIVTHDNNVSKISNKILNLSKGKLK